MSEFWIGFSAGAFTVLIGTPVFMLIAFVWQWYWDVKKGHLGE